MWSWACPALISRASSPGCVVLTMPVSVPRMPRYTGLCAALQALQVGPICLLSSEFAVTSVIWKQTRWIHVCVFYHVLLSGRCVSVIYLICLLRICWALWLPRVPAWGTWKNIWPFHGNPFMKNPGFEAPAVYPVFWIHEHASIKLSVNMLYRWTCIQYSRTYFKSIFKETSKYDGNTEAVDVSLQVFILQSWRQALSSIMACFWPFPCWRLVCFAASILPPRSCSYLSMIFWFPGLDPWSNVCFSLNSPIDSYGLGLGYTLKTPCPSWLRISHCKVHREIHGQRASPSAKQVSLLCVGMIMYSVMPLKLQLWYPSPFYLLSLLGIFHLNSWLSWLGRWK